MAFFMAFREAKGSGMSIDDFMKTWHSLDDLNSDDKLQQNNLRTGNKVTSPTMAEKSKRLGWISPDPSNFDQPDASNGQSCRAEEACEIESLKIPAFDTPSREAFKFTPKPKKSPRALPRRNKEQPPSYKEAQEFEKVDGNTQLRQQTERKEFDADDDSSSEDEYNLKSPPSALDLQHIHDTQQTTPKTLYANLDRRPSGPYEPVDDLMLMSKEDQAHLMNTIRKLQTEQEALQSKLREHDIHLTSLMDRQPSVRRTLRRKVGGNCRSRERPTFQDLAMVQEQARGLENGDNDHLYVQIEQLYSNFCKMHLPANSVKWMLKWKQSRQMLHSKDDIDALEDAFVRRENSQGYWDIVSVQESLALQKENEELKEKVRVLEAKLEAKLEETPIKSNPAMVAPKSSELTMPTIATIPRQCNVRPSKLIKDISGPDKVSKQTVILKKKPFEGTTISDDSIVAGCPIRTHPGIGSVNPVKMKFEWRISDYAKKLEMERKGHQMKIESNRFYINHNGYLGQLEVYLNGNSTGHDRCMSVFLRIMKGEYDHHLHWPVRLCLVLTLFNQVEGRHESLKGGSHGFSDFEYRKPTGCSEDSCDCWGFVKFVSHDMLADRNYISNDSILLGISLTIL